MNYHEATPEATKLVEQIRAGFTVAASLARSANMDRAFAIAPTASCSYRYTDRAGYTTAPEIAPPIGRTVDRDSSTFGVQQFDYGNVETADSVGWDAYFRVCNGIVQMMHDTGLSAWLFIQQLVKTLFNMMKTLFSLGLASPQDLTVIQPSS